MTELVKSGPFDLSVERIDSGYALYFQGSQVKSAQGAPVVCRTPYLLQHMIDEFDLKGAIGVQNGIIEEPKFFSAYAIFGVQNEWIERGAEELATDFGNAIVRDTMLFRCAGSEVMDQMYRWRPVWEFLSDLNVTLPNLIGPFFDDASAYEDLDEYELAKAAATPDPLFVAAVENAYKKMSAPQRAVAMFLHSIHDGVVLFPMVLALGRCTPNEYASGVIAAHGLIGEVFPDVSSEDHQKMFEVFRDNARTAVEYLEFERKVDGLQEMIQAGETLEREFKSTLRFNIKADKYDDAITHSALKTVAAFQNTNGGTLLLGVEDNGNIIGIEKDGFPNDDKFQLHLLNLLKSSMGDNAAANCQFQMHKIRFKTVCEVVCRKSIAPVYLRSKNDESFYVRTGPATTEMRASQIFDYVKTRFGDSAP